MTPGFVTPLNEFSKNFSLSVFVIYLYFYSGVWLIFNAVFLSGVHPLDSLTESHLYILFLILTGLIYTSPVITVC